MGRCHGILPGMNFLAHLWLAEQAQLPLAGANLGDYFRGALPPELPAPLAASVQLHRHIDATSDRHPVVVAARAGFPDGARRYAGILLDLLYDHALALEWRAFSAEPLDDFAGRAAIDVGAEAKWFASSGGPVPSAAGFRALLLSYATEPGLQQAAERTARRLRRPEGMLEAMSDWRARVPALRNDLPVLLEDLRAMAQGFVQAPR